MMDSLHYAARRIGCPLFVFWLASGMVYCLPAEATDFEGVLPAALDQPRIEFLMRNSAVGPPLLSTGLPGDGNHYNVQAFLDTGASGVLISQETAGYFALEPLRWPEPNGPEVEFADVGVAGSDIFHVTQPLYFSTTTSSGETFEDPPLGSYTQTFGPVRAQVGPLTADPNPFLQNLDILGMPAMTGKVVVMEPKPADPHNNPALDLMRNYI
jgi:hypothetical protein